MTTTTVAAIALPTDSGDSFLTNNWWWLTIIGLTLIALISTIAILQPQRQGFGSRVAAGTTVRAGGRHVKKKKSYGPREAGPLAPTMGQRVKRTKVAQNITMRGAQPKPPKPSMFRRMTNWVRDTELADSMRARSEAKQVKSRTKKKPPKIKRRR